MAMVVFLLLLLILQHCSCSPIESDKELSLSNDQRNVCAIQLKMQQIIEMVNAFKLGWNGVKIKIENTKRDIMNDFSQYLQYPEQQEDEDVPHHNFSYYSKFVTSASVYPSSGGRYVEDITSSLVENFVYDISNGINVIQNKMIVLQPLVELQLKICEYCEKKIQWANQTVLVVEKSLNNLMDKSQNGFRVISKAYDSLRTYRLKIIKAKEQKLKNRICSETDEYSKDLCENIPNPTKEND